MDSLHTLIHSLSQTEKRYFKMFASAFKQESNLVRLFDAIAKMTRYDEKEARRLTEIKNLPRAKVALRKLLLKAMRNYQEDIDTPRQLRDTLSDIHFLERKGLRADALKETKNARKLAEQSESYAYLTELMMHSSRLSGPALKPEAIIGYFASLRQQYDKAIDAQKELHSSLLINRYLTTYIQNAKYEAPEEVEKIILSILSEARQKLPDTRSFRARITLLNTLAFSERDEKQGMEIYHQIGEIYRDNKPLATSYPMAYMAYLSNYSMLVAPYKKKGELTLSLFAKTEKCFVDFAHHFRRFPEDKDYYYQRLTCNKLTYVRANKDWAILPGLEKEVYKHILQADKAQPGVSALQTSMLVACFYDQHKYDKAIDWINTYYTLDDSKLLKPLLFCMRLYEVLVLYQGKDYDQSDTKAVNLYKTMKRQGFQGEYYSHIGTLLRRLNHWALSEKKCKLEAEKLVDAFVKLKKKNNPLYEMYAPYFEPDDILSDILAERAKRL